MPGSQGSLDPAGRMAKTVSDLARVADTLVLECNNDHAIGRIDPENFVKASLSSILN